MKGTASASGTPRLRVDRPGRCHADTLRRSALGIVHSSPLTLCTVAVELVSFWSPCPASLPTLHSALLCPVA
eukprot:15129775-Alexandrium_andersonii.AAC.1